MLLCPPLWWSQGWSLRPSCRQAQETLPSYPDICFAVDDYDDTFQAVVRHGGQ